MHPCSQHSYTYCSSPSHLLAASQPAPALPPSPYHHVSTHPQPHAHTYTDRMRTGACACACACVRAGRCRMVHADRRLTVSLLVKLPLLDVARVADAREAWSLGTQSSRSGRCPHTKEEECPQTNGTPPACSHMVVGWLGQAYQVLARRGAAAVVLVRCTLVQVLAYLHRPTAASSLVTCALSPQSIASLHTRSTQAAKQPNSKATKQQSNQQSHKAGNQASNQADRPLSVVSVIH